MNHAQCDQHFDFSNLYTVHANHLQVEVRHSLIRNQTCLITDPKATQQVI